ncbi:MAG: 4Fe-4S binding protein [Mogibacterium sp.]|nr:4Fe-4S binding protein [Mogibacterium sp.]
MFRSAKDIHENSPWQQLTPGAEIYEPGTSRLVRTGEWRTLTPVFDPAACRQCLLCVPFCPDASIPVSDSRRGETDLDHCKGCGICAKVCPFHAITMEQEVR